MVGAGACGTAFTDTLIAHSEANVVLVDRRHRPGGHWNDDYPFVRLHQPSAYYGVDSLTLGRDRIDVNGPNAGFYERASGAEICAYYGRVLEENLLGSGQVRFLGMHDYLGEVGGYLGEVGGYLGEVGGYLGEVGGEHHIKSLVTGETKAVRVRRSLVDATYISTTIPSMHKPSFSIDPAVRVIPPNDLVDLAEAGSGFTVIGAGKTSMDTCCWLIDQGVASEQIRWIRPRDPYTVDRSWMQPLSLMGSMIEWLALQNEAAAEAEDPYDLLRRVEANGVLQRLDPDVRPSVFRGATLSHIERDSLRSIENVVRLGRVIHVGVDRIELTQGSVATDAKQIYVDCSAQGLGTPSTRPIFEPGRITIQRVQAGVDPFNAALIGRVEATGREDAEKNRLCPPNDMRGEAITFGSSLLVMLRARVAWLSDPDVGQWFGTTRLSPTRDAAKHMTDEARASIGRLIKSTAPAIENLERMLNARVSRRVARH